ncbi:MAG: TIGR03118 family protein [Bryobacteraceae bacterium]
MSVSKALRYFVGAGAIPLLVAALAGNAPAQQYVVTTLVTNSTDPDLVNAWGLARSSTSPWWVADQVTGKSTLYNAAGTKQGLVVTLPGGHPTGAIFYGGTGFIVPGTSKPAVFIFASTAGQIFGWNPSLTPITTAEVLTATSGAAYTGATILTHIGQDFLYAADFHNARVDVFDSMLSPVDFGSDAFVLEGPEHSGFAPFNIQNIGNVLFVTYAKQDAQKIFDVPGPGNGYVAAFTYDGKLIKEFQHGIWLSSPWGLSMAPSDFGKFSHTILVGMFGSGQIAAYDFLTGNFRGLLNNANGDPISISGLWGISFGSSVPPALIGAGSGAFNTLYFAAGTTIGTARGAGGAFGTVTPVTTDLIEGNDQ